NFALLFQEIRHFAVGHRLCEFSVDLVEFAQQIDDRLYSLFHDFTYCFVRIKLRLLLQETDGVAGRNSGLALKVLLHGGKDLQERTLSRTVEADHANLGAIKIGEIDVFEYSLLIVELVYSNHGVNDFIGNRTHEESKLPGVKTR